jgi:ATP/maltotriose-dependent transcriptional regulator MalT
VTNEIETLLGKGFEALTAGGWMAAKESFEAVLATTEVAEAHFGLASASFWLGDMSGTITNYERAYAAFRRRPDPMYAAFSAMALVVHNKQHLGNRAAASGWLARATTLIEESSLEPLRAPLLVTKAYETEDPKLRESWGREALEIARRTGNLDWELNAMSVLGKALCEQGRIAEGTAQLDEAMAGALGGQSSLDAVVFTSCQTMSACAGCAEFERAAQWVRASDRFTKTYGCPFLYAECRTIYGRVLLATGEWGRCEEELESAISMAKGSAPAYHVQAAATLAELRVAQGRLEDAERLLAEWEGYPEVLAVTARLRLIRGEHALAAATLQRRLDVIGVEQIESADLLELLGEAEIMQGDAVAAGRRGDALAKLGRVLGCQVIVAHAERLRGRALGAIDARRARRPFDIAVAEFVRMAMPYQAARTRLFLAQVAYGTEPDVAASEARAALTAFESLGAGRDADAAAAFLRERGLKVGRPGPRSLGTLTKREREVLDLLKEGLSNPDIAERLFLSRRTVEHHVASILSKLGLRTRAEAAATSVSR